MRILIVDDDRALTQLLRRSLLTQSEEIETAHSPVEALEAFAAREPSLVVLDLEMRVRVQGGRSAGAEQLKPAGLEILEAVRAAAPLCAVLVLSAAADAPMRVRCLELGADDCLQKPFSLAELRARCGTLLRRRRGLEDALALPGMISAEQTALLSAGDVTMDRLRRTATLAGVPLPVTGREYALLEQLLLAGGGVVTRGWMLEVFGQGSEGNVVDVHVGALRRKLGFAPGAPRIETVRGEGYRLVQTSAAPAAVAGRRGTGPSAPAEGARIDVGGGAWRPA